MQNGSFTVKKPSRTNKDTRQKSKAENLEKSRLSAFFVASLPGFEPGAFRLGVDPISHREVTPDAKKCLEILGFSPFPIPSDTML